MKAKRKTIIIVSLVVVFVIMLSVTYMIYDGYILLNNLSLDKYPVRGIDVSSYQGDIDWEIIESHNIHFAFIKATEGSRFVDPKFEYNYSNANKTNLRIGAYHFFSYDSSGEMQAKNFTSTVQKTKNMLPPVIDIEFYGNKEKNLPDKKATQRELKVLLRSLENKYKMRPIIYATEKSYKLYIADDFKDYDIWIRNVFFEPTLCDGRTWTFWQYTDGEKLSGYTGKEKHIDMNVYNGTMEEFNKYPNCVLKEPPS